MAEVINLTDQVNSEVKNMSDAERKQVLDKFRDLSFSPTSNTSITEADTSKMVPMESLDTTVTNIFQQYNEKFGVKLKYEDFRDAIVTITNVNYNEREIRRIINSEIITNVTDILTTKSILIMSKVISDQLDKIDKLSCSGGLTGEIISMISEMFGWIEKLEEIKKRYRLFDVDSKIKDLLRGEDSNNLIRTPEQERILGALKSALIK